MTTPKDGAHKTFNINGKPSLSPEQLLVVKELFNGKRLQKDLLRVVAKINTPSGMQDDRRKININDKFSKHIVTPLKEMGLIIQYSDEKDKRQQYLELSRTVKAAATILKNIHYISILQTQGDNVYLNYKKFVVLSRVTKNIKDYFPTYGEIRKAFYAGTYFKKFKRKQRNKIEMDAIFPLQEQGLMYSSYANHLLETLNSLDKIFLDARIAIYPKQFSEKARSLHEEFLQLRSYLLSTSISPLTKKSINKELINLLLKNVAKAKDNTKEYFPLSVKEMNDILEHLRKIIDICTMLPILPIQPINKSPSGDSKKV